MRKVVVWVAVAFLGLTACGADDDDGGAGFGAMGGGGASGSSGAGGSAGGKMPTGECAMANLSIGNSALHANAMMALTSNTCSGSTSCHQGNPGKAMLSLKDKTDMRALLVGKPACNAPNLHLVDGRGDAAALANSWLWIKLTGTVNSTNEVTGMASWGTPGNCEQPTVGTYGIRMPFGFGSGMTWSDVNKVRDWICAGAPGP